MFTWLVYAFSFMSYFQLFFIFNVVVTCHTSLHPSLVLLLASPPHALPLSPQTTRTPPNAFFILPYRRHHLLCAFLHSHLPSYTHAPPLYGSLFVPYSALFRPLATWAPNDPFRSIHRLPGAVAAAAAASTAAAAAAARRKTHSSSFALHHHHHHHFALFFFPLLSRTVS